jgi:hypothetical protein
MFFLARGEPVGLPAAEAGAEGAAEGGNDGRKEEEEKDGGAAAADARSERVECEFEAGMDGEAAPWLVRGPAAPPTGAIDTFFSCCFDLLLLNQHCCS